MRHAACLRSAAPAIIGRSMLDAPIRRLIDPPLARIAAAMAPLGVSANTLTVAGFAFGLTGAGLIATGNFLWALGFILLNRAADGLDGAVARRNGTTDLGAFLDISLDFVFYASVPFAFALAQPEDALPAAFLLFAFMAPAATFLAFAIFAQKRGIATDLRGKKSFYYLGGLSEGTETFLAFAIMCLWPGLVDVVCYVYGVMCFITGGTRVAAGMRAFGGDSA